MGVAGGGKSTVLNRLIGSEIFRCGFTGIKNKFCAYETADFHILETPGLYEVDDMNSWTN